MRHLRYYFLVIFYQLLELLNLNKELQFNGGNGEVPFNVPFQVLISYRLNLEQTDA